MVLDTSALVAILSGEPEQEDLVRAMVGAPRILVSSATLVETSLVLEARHGEAAGRELDLLLHRSGARIVAVDAEQAELARAAWRRYGKGRHRAGLNFGDLFAYALSRATGEPLLFKGEDFTRTDVQSA